MLNTIHTLKYCLTCGRIAAVLPGHPASPDGIEFHLILKSDEFGQPSLLLSEICDGPFATSTPPENFEEDWDIDLVEPSQEELAKMNLNAEMLLQELENS